MYDFPSDELLGQNPELRHRFDLLKAIKNGQESLWKDPCRGLSMEAFGGESLDSMQEKSLKQGEPISFQLDDSSYCLETLRKSLISLIYEVYEQEPESTMDSESLVHNIDLGLKVFVVNALRGDGGYFESLGEEWDVSSLVLSIVAEALIQPSMIHIASSCQRAFLDDWGDVPCPVCGRYPSTVVKYEEGAWRFKCHLCQAEYKMDIFLCPHCKSGSPEEKEFLLVGKSQEFEVASCSKCNRYYKVINKSKLKESIPEGLEDLYTYFLDEIAYEKGLIRLDDKTSGV